MGFYGILLDLPSGYVKISTENGPFILDLVNYNGDLPWLCYFTGGNKELKYPNGNEQRHVSQDSSALITLCLKKGLNMKLGCFCHS